MKNGDKPAFPNKPYPEFAEDFRTGFVAFGGINPTGISKREYFAALALSQAVATWYNHTNEELVRRSIAIADELLKQLEL